MKKFAFGAMDKYLALIDKIEEHPQASFWSAIGTIILAIVVF